MKKIFFILTLFLLVIIAGCSFLGRETLTPGEESWTMIAQYPTETPIACKTGILWAQVLNDLGTEWGIADSVWFKESDYPQWESGWLLEKDYGYFILSYNADDEGCITEAEGVSVVSDYENAEVQNYSGFVLAAVPTFFDERVNVYSEEPEGETAEFLSKEIEKCTGEEYRASFADSSGNTWGMTCGYYQDGSLFSIQYQKK